MYLFARNHQNNVTCVILMYQTLYLGPESIPISGRQSTPAVPGRSPPVSRRCVQLVSLVPLCYSGLL